MRKEDFDELIESVKEMVVIQRGELEPARVTRYEMPDTAKVRANLKMSQNDFAILLGISKRTLEGWEQGRRYPSGAARVLLLIAERHPDIIANTLGIMMPKITVPKKKKGVKTKVRREAQV
ncbi:MAG: NadS family protein [Trueperaceae bacterium]